MMLNYEALFQGIINWLNGTDGLNFGITIPIIQGLVPETISKPYCSFNVINDTSIGAFNARYLDSAIIQFSSYVSGSSTAQSQAIGWANKIGLALNGAALNLSDGVNVGCVRRPGIRVQNLGTDPKNQVYVANVVVEFYVGTSEIIYLQTEDGRILTDEDSVPLGE